MVHQRTNGTTAEYDVFMDNLEGARLLEDNEQTDEEWTMWSHMKDKLEKTGFELG